MTLKWKRTNNLGKFGIEVDSRVPESASIFLSKITQNYVVEATALHPDINTWMFEWGELSNQHTLGFGIRQSGAATFLEHPIDREKPENVDPSSGRLDIWVLDPKIKAIFLIEYKHTVRQIPDSEATADETKGFADATDQIDTILPASVRDMRIRKDWPVFGISLLSVGLWRETSMTLGSGQSEVQSNVIAEMNFVNSSLNPRPRWSACWLLPSSKRDAPESDYQPGDFTAEQPVGMLWFARTVKMS